MTPPDYCKRCRFYYGANRVVCGIHPYGPDSETCNDYVPQSSGLDQSKTSINMGITRQVHDWKVWHKLLMLGLLLGTLSSSCILGLLLNHTGGASNQKSEIRRSQTLGGHPILHR